MSLTDDEELVLDAQNGSEDALETLMKRYKGLVNKISRCYFLVGGDIEDIIQEGTIGLYKAIKHFSQQKNASFKTFAATCIKHQIQSAVKIASNEKNKVLSTAISIAEQVHEDDEEDNEIVLPSEIPSPDDMLLEREGMEELKQVIIDTLSPLEYKILTLYLKGYKYNEIAEMAKISKKSIDNGLTRIKNKLSFLKK